MWHQPSWRPRFKMVGSGTCAACGEKLTGKLRWFCRAPAWCRTAYMANHDWGMARAIALRRSSPTGRVSDARCVRDACRHTSLEVNHITPLEGPGYAMGCVHHQDNLEVLCGPHHRMETARQRGHKGAAPQPGQLELPL